MHSNLFNIVEDLTTPKQEGLRLSLVTKYYRALHYEEALKLFVTKKS